MAAPRIRSMAARRPSSLLAAALLVFALAALRMQLAFLPATGGGAPASSPSTGRRGALLAAVAGASLSATVQEPMPAFAAGGAENLLVSGAPESWDKLNGQYTLMDGQSINDRGVYKRDGQDLYLMANSCGNFQISKELDGKCEGVAMEKKGNWRIGQLAVRGFKVKPVKKDTKEEVQAVRTKSEAEGDMELLQANEGVNVGQYIKAKGGGDFLNNVLKLDDNDAKIADSLEARLGSMRYR